MPRRPCLDCGAPTSGSRCTDCRRDHDRTRRPDPAARGYDADYRGLRKEILAEHPDCWWCPAPATTIDHVVPLARGGDNDRSNLVPACARCNERRGARG